MTISFGRFSNTSPELLASLQLINEKKKEDEAYFRNKARSKNRLNMLTQMIGERKTKMLNGSNRVVEDFSAQKEFLKETLGLSAVEDIQAGDGNGKLGDGPYFNELPPMKFRLAEHHAKEKKELIERYNTLRYLDWLMKELNALGDFYEFTIEKKLHREQITEKYAAFYDDTSKYTSDHTQFPFATAAISLCALFITSPTDSLRLIIEALPTKTKDICQNACSVLTARKKSLEGNPFSPIQTGRPGAGPKAKASEALLLKIKEHAKKLKGEDKQAQEKAKCLELFIEEAEKAAEPQQLDALAKNLSPNSKYFSYRWKGERKPLYSHRNWWGCCIFGRSQTQQKIEAWLEAVTPPQSR